MERITRMAIGLLLLSLLYSINPLSENFPLSQQAIAAMETNPTREEAEAALKKAVAFFRDKAAVHGGYLWRYSSDLSKREGEGKVGETTAWIQPPGTPYVGEALVELFELTGDRFYLEAARETAMALVQGQMHSGGWESNIEFDSADRQRYAYRTDGERKSKARNSSTLDDDKTQSATRFLIHYDQATNFEDETLHEAAFYALDSLLAAQFANGGWAHAYDGPVEKDRYPVIPANYREDGEYPQIKEHWKHYTINDNLMRDVIETLTLAARVYKEDRYLEAAKKAGDFLILAQMPEPQPGWAQQYDYDMHPAWARKFEPPSITGGESQRIMMVLMDLYEITGERKYLSPIPKALEYYKRSLLPDGRLARFYELKTNKPLYFTRDYEITYDDSDMPTHYAFKVSSELDRIEKRYNKISKTPWSPPNNNPSIPKPTPETIRQIMETMDKRGAWVEEGRLRYWGDEDDTRRIISPSTFVENAMVLGQYVYHRRALGK